MGSVVLFSGTDGAGKSTQISLLRNALNRRGYRTGRFWARGGYTPLFSWVKWLLRLSKAPVIPKQGDLVLRGERFQSKRLRRIWLRAAIIDLILYYGFFVRMRQFFLHYVLCDRFLEDTLLDFKRNFPEEDVSRWGLWRLLGMVAPRPSHRFLLLVTPDVSAQRSVEKNEPFPDSIQTLEWRYAWYRKMAEDGQWFVLDGREPVQVVHARIMSELGLCE